MTLVITDKEMVMFDKLAKERDIQLLYRHCLETFPSWSKIMGKDAVYTVIREAAQQAEQSGLTMKKSILLYLDAVVLFGTQFEQDKQYASIKFQDTHEAAKAFYFQKALNQYQTQVIGEGHVYLKEMHYRLENGVLPKWQHDNFIEDMMTYLMWLYPQKVDFIGEEHCVKLILNGQEKALTQYGFSDSNQQAFYLLLMFILGEYFDTDKSRIWLNWAQVTSQIRGHHYTLNALAHALVPIVQ